MESINKDFEHPNQRYTYLYTRFVGTLGYCDPQYLSSCKLTKESDIYSFGVVLFKVLCGRLCFECTNNEVTYLVPKWKQSYKNKKLDHIIFRDLTPTIDPTSLKIVSDIAFECLHDSREKRPTASRLAKKLESALKCQETHVMKLTNAVGTFRKMPAIFSNLGRKVFQHSKKSPQHTSAEGEKNRFVLLNEGFYGLDLLDLLNTTARLLGEGTTGKSYMLVLEKNNIRVVVKTLNDVVVTKNEFEKLTEVLGKIKSKHLVPLIAYFYSDNGKWLVYEYVPARSLSDHLHGSYDMRRTQIDWGHRMRIAMSTAKGMAYLHVVGEVVHGNIKSSNILVLQENFEICMTDYGLNTLFGSFNDHHVTGYMAPEFLDTRTATFKCDVYSFGVLLLELLTGKNPNQGVSLANEGVKFSNWVESIVCEEPEADIFDVELRTDDNVDEMAQLLRIAKDCVSNVPDQRPAMHDVVSMMEDMWLRRWSDDYSKGNDETRDAPSTITP